MNQWMDDQCGAVAVYESIAIRTINLALCESSWSINGDGFFTSEMTLSTKNSMSLCSLYFVNNNFYVFLRIMYITSLG